jgi:hypothetical protein
MKYSKIEIGSRFGRLEVVGYAGTIGTGNAALASWKVKCDCGTEKTITGVQLRRTRNPSKSCGCLQKEWASKLCTVNSPKKMNYEELREAEAYNHFRNQAKQRGIDFKLSPTELVELIVKSCYYCNKEPSNIFRIKNRKDLSWIIKYQGIDRIDSNKGYVLDNCRPCCKQCNVAKLDQAESDFLEHISKLYNNLKNKGLIK